jgi:hypothetical protein
VITQAQYLNIVVIAAGFVLLVMGCFTAARYHLIWASVLATTGVVVLIEYSIIAKHLLF